ncbi:MAG TPA: 5-dehydro-2-deoxygluconokinase [Candidatus Dormibacteraeota bacterium]|jgi:5-dehydro-2-deoxygluconokinase|nr:5-dehydro-2-deoxygluconokinase [Candidatus Dormibacteraeota bacterium]
MLEVITMGRVSVDLYPEQIGVPLAEVRTFAKSLGGSPTNVAVAAARLGHEVALITKVGEEGFGPYVRRALTEFGVDTRWVGSDPDLRTPLAFCEIFPPDHFPLTFYRAPSAPDMRIREDELDLDAIAGVPLFSATHSGLYEEPTRTATLAALRARRRRQHTIFDCDYRPMFWRSVEDARRAAVEAIPLASVVVGNREEMRMATGLDDPRAIAAELFRQGVSLAIVKLGPAGVYAATPEESVTVPPVPVEVVCGLGAGDAFGGALCHGLLLGTPLRTTIEFANAAGAIVASRLACADAMPTPSEVEALLASRLEA